MTTRIVLADLLSSPLRLGTQSAARGDLVDVVSPRGRPLFPAVVEAPGKVYTKTGVDAGYEAYEVRSVCHMTCVRNRKTGELYNVFARADDKGKTLFVYDPVAEFRLVRVVNGGQPRVSMV